jgi:hypothetical protein
MFVMMEEVRYQRLWISLTFQQGPIVQIKSAGGLV